MKKTFSNVQASSFNGRRLIWGASLLSLCVLPACSDSDNDSEVLGAEKTAPELTEANLVVDANQGSRVTTYRIGGTRSVVVNNEDGTQEITLEAGDKLPAVIPADTTYIVSGSVELADGATTLTINGGLKSTGVASFAGVTITVAQGGTLDVVRLNATNLIVEGSAKVGKSTLISANVTVSGEGTLAVSDDIEVVGDVTVAGTAEVAVASGKTLTIDGTLYVNSTTAKFTSSEAVYSFIDAKAVEFANADLTTNFGYGYYTLYAADLVENDNITDYSSLEQPATLYFTTTAANIKAWKNQLAHGTTILKQAVSVTSYNKGDLSATGITLNGNDVYVSYHTRGEEINGAIDYATMSGLTAGSLSTLTFDSKINGQAVQGIEFNHIAALNGKIYAVGSVSRTRDANNTVNADKDDDGLATPTGDGCISVIDPTAKTVQTRTLFDGDGNSVIVNGDYVQVASVYGLETYRASDMLRVAVKQQTGHAKSIIKNGGKVVVLSYANAIDKTNTTAEYTKKENDEYVGLVKMDVAVSTYNDYDYTYEDTPGSITLTSSVLAPVYGKNTIATDGTVYYAACGAYGVATSTNLSFVLPANKTGNVAQGYANSVAVDANYVYVAYGSAGVYVLNKTDLSVVASYTNAGGKSANYIAVDASGNIYVAYGQAGWQVLQLTTVK